MNFVFAVKSALRHKPCLKPSTPLLNLASRILNFTTGSSFNDLESSFQIFNQIENPNGFVFNTLMKSYLLSNSTHNVLNVYKNMLSCQIPPDNYTYPMLIQACNSRLSALEGNQVHVHVLKMGFCCDLHVRNTLMNLYAVCDDMRSARQVFDEIPVLDSVSWNTILAGYVLMGDLEEACEIYRQMPGMNVISFETRNLFGSRPESDMLSWSAFISGYEQNELYPKAIAVCKEMLANGIVIDEVLVLSACAYLNAIDAGRRQVHGLAFKISIDTYVTNIHMNAQCDKLSEFTNLDSLEWKSTIHAQLTPWSTCRTRSLFSSIPKEDVVSWSAMISRYAQHDLLWEALALLKEMLVTSMRPDVSLRAREDALIQVKSVDSYLRKNGLKINNTLGTILIHMYMKCGSVRDASQVFSEIEEKGVSAWNAILLGLANNGLDNLTLLTFSNMKSNEFIPNEITYFGVVVACRNMRLVNEGMFYFNLMETRYSLEPNVKHYGCMVGVLRCAGFFEEAGKLIKCMPIKPDVPKKFIDFEDEWKEADIFMKEEAKHSRMAMGREHGRTQDWK